MTLTKHWRVVKAHADPSEMTRGSRGVVIEFTDEENFPGVTTLPRWEVPPGQRC